VVHDRDVNAAINLRGLAVSSTVIACGGAGADFACKRKMKLVPVKQESNGKET
jgi:putative transposase